jgi:hypothetical protein
MPGATEPPTPVPAGLVILGQIWCLTPETGELPPTPSASLATLSYSWQSSYSPLSRELVHSGPLPEPLRDLSLHNSRRAEGPAHEPFKALKTGSLQPLSGLQQGQQSTYPVPARHVIQHKPRTQTRDWDFSHITSITYTLSHYEYPTPGYQILNYTFVSLGSTASNNFYFKTRNSEKNK